jgi:hypothetical protein
MYTKLRILETLYRGGSVHAICAGSEAENRY